MRVPSASTAPSANPVEQDEEPAVSGEEGEAHYFAANDLDLAAYSSSPDHWEPDLRYILLQAELREEHVEEDRAHQRFLQERGPD